MRRDGDIPPSRDARWREWCKPLAAFLRAEPRARAACEAFCLLIGMSKRKAWNVLPWLENEGYAVSLGGTLWLTPAGHAWLGDFQCEMPSPPPSAPASPKPLAPKKDLHGEPFDRLRAIEPARCNARGEVFWLCECACGRRTVVNGNKLRAGRTRSCGCLKRDMAVRQERGARGLFLSSWRVA